MTVPQLQEKVAGKKNCPGAIYSPLLLPREINTRVIPPSTKSRGHQAWIKVLNEKGTILREKTRSAHPKTTKAQEETKYRGLKPPWRRQPTGRRARPENTESRGQAREKGRVIMCRADKKRKIPAMRKKDAKNKYKDCLFRLIASMAKTAPATTNRNDKKTEILEVFSKKPRRNVIPKIISESPIMNTSLAANFLKNLELIHRI